MLINAIVEVNGAHPMPCIPKSLLKAYFYSNSNNISYHRSGVSGFTPGKGLDGTRRGSSLSVELAAKVQL